MLQKIVKLKKFEPEKRLRTRSFLDEIGIFYEGLSLNPKNHILIKKKECTQFRVLYNN